MHGTPLPSSAPNAFKPWWCSKSNNYTFHSTVPMLLEGTACIKRAAIPTGITWNGYKLKLTVCTLISCSLLHFKSNGLEYSILHPTVIQYTNLLFIKMWNHSFSWDMTYIWGLDCTINCRYRKCLIWFTLNTHIENKNILMKMYWTNDNWCCTCFAIINEGI